MMDVISYVEKARTIGIQDLVLRIKVSFSLCILSFLIVKYEKHMNV